MPKPINIEKRFNQHKFIELKISDNWKGLFNFFNGKYFLRLHEKNQRYDNPYYYNYSTHSFVTSSSMGGNELTESMAIDLANQLQENPHKFIQKAKELKIKEKSGKELVR